MHIEKRVVHEEKVIVAGDQFSKITYEDNSVILLKYNPKTKRWIEIQFANITDEENERIKSRIINAAIQIACH